MFPPPQQKQPEIDATMLAMYYFTQFSDSCIGRAALGSGAGKKNPYKIHPLIIGYVSGLAFGVFFASIRYSDFNPASMANPNATQSFAELPLRQQFKEAMRDTGRSAVSSAKNFGKIGGLYAGTECIIESVVFLFKVGLMIVVSGKA
jgi:hypothetical protein